MLDLNIPSYHPGRIIHVSCGRHYVAHLMPAAKHRQFAASFQEPRQLVTLRKTGLTFSWYFRNICLPILVFVGQSSCTLKAQKSSYLHNGMRKVCVYVCVFLQSSLSFLSHFNPKSVISNEVWFCQKETWIYNSFYLQYLGYMLKIRWIVGV